MASDIWKVCSQTNARDYYNKVEDDKSCWLCSVKGDVTAALSLAARDMAILLGLKDATKDSNTYEFDIEDISEEINSFQNDIMEKVQKLELEIMVLKRKEENGTITEEEREELAAKTNEVSSLMAEYDNKSQEANEQIQDKVQQCQSSFSGLDSKLTIAKNYGNASQDLAEELNDKEVECKAWWDSDEIKETWTKARNKAVNALLNKSGKLLKEVTNIEKTENNFNKKYSYTKTN